MLPIKYAYMECLKKLTRIILLPLIKTWQLHYRLLKVQKSEHLREMSVTPLEGYTNKPYYLSSETVSFFIKSDSPYKLTIEQIVAPFQYHKIEEFDLPEKPQKTVKDPCETGCNWEKTLSLSIKRYRSGYYRAKLVAKGKANFYITFTVQREDVSPEIIVIAPVSTWLAYNPYGGKSAYKNILDSKNVHRVSNQRPNTALQYKPEGCNIHDMNVEANIFNWFSKNYNTALIPDTFLERDLIRFKKAKIWVLAYHCEYMSFKMHKTLRDLVYKDKKSLINLGGNQLYWKVKYDTKEQVMEVRKDCTFFDNSLLMGGLWRHTLHPEAKLFGTTFSDSGTGTYAPYKVLKPEHWLYKGLHLNKEDLFGLRGINNLPICGDETDKKDPVFGEETEVVAKGLNCFEIGEQEVFGDKRFQWDGKGGGEIALKTYSNQHACLSTGSIQSGSGLGTDPIFTNIVQNFLDKYLNT